MARPQMVTRTFVTTKAKILSVKVSTEKTEIEEITLPRTYKTNDEILKIAQKNYGDNDTRFVHVIEKEEVETLYGMSEADFLKHAKVLPPRGTKNDGATDEITE